MKKYVPYGKMSKRARKAEDKKARVVWSDWGVGTPRTRIVENKKAYSRKKAKQDMLRV